MGRCFHKPDFDRFHHSPQQTDALPKCGDTALVKPFCSNTQINLHEYLSCENTHANRTALFVETLDTLGRSPVRMLYDASSVNTNIFCLMFENCERFIVLTTTLSI